jgi:hypothetical protein
MSHPSRVLVVLLLGVIGAVVPGCNTSGGGKRAGADPARRGWVPDGAVEATEASSLHANPQGDPLCSQPPSALDIGKAFAVSLERELRESTKISDDEESRIGKRLEAGAAKDRSFAGKWDLPGDVHTYGKYLGGLVQHLAKKKARAGIHYRVHVVRRPEFNAAALPGGALMVYTGLLEGPHAVHDEAELVAVLGHEIAHVEKRHTIAAYQYAKAILGNDADAGLLAIKILSTPLSSEHELEADEHGLELAVKGQYDPQAAVNLWRRRAASEPAGPLGGLEQALDQLIRSHPRAAVRACRAMGKVSWAHDHSPWDRLYDGRSNLRTRVMGPSRTY